MADSTFLQWPFFDAPHRTLAPGIEAWAGDNLGEQAPPGHDAVEAACRDRVAMLGEGGWLRHCAPTEPGGTGPSLDVRTLCLLRETLARHDGLADFALAMQGLGAGPLVLYGSPELKRRYLPGIASGQRIAAFALSEPESGSDVASLQTRARRDGSSFVLDGTKTWISNAGIAHQYIVFARTDEAPGARGISAFVVDADNPGLRVSARIQVTAPHPLGTLTLEGCRVPADQQIGAPGKGFGIAMATLDTFRSTVGAAALGFARRALDAALDRTARRQAFGGPLRELDAVQGKLGQMALEIDAAALLIYRAAWTHDTQPGRVTREAAMAKLYATESAQRVVDEALQLHGATGVVADSPMEHLYREIRPLRIYEGTSDILRQVIARHTIEGKGST